MEINGNAEKWSYLYWNINNFYSLRELKLTNHKVQGAKFDLILRLKMNSYNSEEDCYELHCTGTSSKSLTYYVCVYVKDKKGNDHFKQTSTIAIRDIPYSSRLQNNERSSGVAKLWSVKRRDLQGKYRLLLQNDGYVKITCMFGPEAIYQGGKQESVKGNQSVQTSSDWFCMESLSEDFHNYMVNDTEPDIRVICGEETFFVHKSILCARSSVFKAMFRSNMVENLRGSINVEDMDSTHLKQFIQYIYSGKLPELSKENASHLYAASSKYAVHALMKKCANYLIENITEEDALSLIILADAHSDEDFKKRIVTFVNKDDEILEDEDVSESYKNILYVHGVQFVPILLRYFARFI